MGGTALVTGAARRIGRAIALALADRGYDIALHYGSSAEAARTTASDIEARGRACHLFPCDLGRFDEVRRLVPAVAAKCPDLSVLVNNASIFEKGSLLGTDADLFDRQFAINLKVPFFLAQDFARHCKAGSIVNLVDQRITRSDPAYLAYTLTKKALASLTEMAARELAPRIRVNGVCPGLILPPEGKDASHLERLAAGVPMKATGSPEKVAAAVIYLVENDYVTGQLLFVDGGEHLV